MRKPIVDRTPMLGYSLGMAQHDSQHREPNADRDTELRSLLHDMNNVFTQIVSTLDLVLEDLPENSPLKADLVLVSGSSTQGMKILRTMQETLLRSV